VTAVTAAEAGSVVHYSGVDTEAPPFPWGFVAAKAGRGFEPSASYCVGQLVTVATRENAW